MPVSGSAQLFKWIAECSCFLPVKCGKLGKKETLKLSFWVFEISSWVNTLTVTVITNSGSGKMIWGVKERWDEGEDFVVRYLWEIQTVKSPMRQLGVGITELGSFVLKQLESTEMGWDYFWRNDIWQGNIYLFLYLPQWRGDHPYESFHC